MTPGARRLAPSFHSVGLRKARTEGDGGREGPTSGRHSVGRAVGRRGQSYGLGHLQGRAPLPSAWEEGSLEPEALVGQAAADA